VPLGELPELPLTRSSRPFRSAVLPSTPARSRRCRSRPATWSDAEPSVRGCVVSGGTSSGKTRLLGVLSAFVPDDERLVTIEDAAELRLAKPHVVALDSRRLSPRLTPPALTADESLCPGSASRGTVEVEAAARPSSPS
jgi:hypothetical protein